MIPPLDTADLLAAERRDLAPYASFADATQGRRHPETAHPLRTDFQRDRDRVVHSHAFRRLEYKTQAFVTGISDHYRTRLTHTIEVAGIARTICRGLRLNQDLAEAIALAHDLGHSPFGHCGERELNRRMAAHGGFDHNRQSLRIVDELEYKYPGYRGLNLTHETRTGLLKHRGAGHDALDGQPLPPQPHLEAQVADLADDLTYYAHDLDDGIGAELLQDADLAHLGLWQVARRRVAEHGVSPGDDCYYPFMIRNLLDSMVADVIAHSQARIAKAGIATAAEAERRPEPLVAFSPAYAEHCRELRAFLFERVYWHETVVADNETAVAAMGELFAYFLAHPRDLGRKARARIAEQGLERTVADYIAGMTDRYAIQQYRQFIGHFPREG